MSIQQQQLTLPVVLRAYSVLRTTYFTELHFPEFGSTTVVVFLCVFFFAFADRRRFQLLLESVGGF